MEPVIVNLEETPGKTVGRIRPRTLADYDWMVDQADALLGRLPFPKGVYRFRSFEEANAWKEKYILEAAVKKYRERHGSPT
jgi:hypothetical protein